jgi:fructokinase
MTVNPMTVKVVGLGEVLWDLLPAGPQLGGAPANFAYHVHALGELVGAKVDVITRIGSDDNGREILHRFHAMDLGTTTAQVDDIAATGTATVELSANGLAHFTIQENVAWDFLDPTGEALAAASAADAICFGTLAQRSARSRTTIQQLVAASPPNALRVFDINLRPPFYSHAIIEESLGLANVLKLNDEELPILAEMFNSCGADTPVRLLAAEQPGPPTRVSAPDQIKHQIESLARRFGLRLVALTRGANGSLLYQVGRNQCDWSDCPSRPVKVVDTVGAGDSFTAALVLGVLQKMDLDEINCIANAVASYVCSQPGATPQLPLQFAQRFSSTR